MTPDIKCKHCNKLVYGDPAALRNHLRTEHPMIMRTIDREMLPKESHALGLALSSGLRF